MKRFLKVLLFTFVFFYVANVNAQSYDVGTLIPVNNSATVETDTFTYNDINFNNYDNSGYRLISFQSITRKSSGNSPIPISINVLLFDSEEKNIGYVTYCSEKDYDGDYSGYTIKSSQSSPFTIKLVKKYFVNKDDTLKSQYTFNDIAYYSVLDDNHFCKVGGYDKYKGLTLEQINSGELSNAKTKTVFNFSDIIPSISGGVLVIVISLLIVFIALFIFGSILNALYKRMYAEKTALAYIPITNSYVCVKLAFGKIVSLIYIILFFISIPLSFVGVGMIFSSLLDVFCSIAFIVVIIKLITKKYDLFYFEPSVKSNINQVSNYNSDVSTNSAYLNRDESLLNNGNSMSLDSDSNSNFNSNSNSNSFNSISAGSSSMNNEFNFNSSNLNNTNNTNNSFNSNTFNEFNSNNYNTSNNAVNTNNPNNSFDALYDSINDDNESDSDMFNMNSNVNNSQSNQNSLYNDEMDNNFFNNQNNDSNNSDGGSDLSNMFR